MRTWAPLVVTGNRCGQDCGGCVSSLAGDQRHQAPTRPQLAVPLPDGLPSKASGLELGAPQVLVRESTLEHGPARHSADAAAANTSHGARPEAKGFVCFSGTPQQ